MSRSGEGTGSEQKASVEVVKDRNGMEQILLKNPRGASVRVSIDFISFLSR